MAVKLVDLMDPSKAALLVDNLECWLAVHWEALWAGSLENELAVQ